MKSQGKLTIAFRVEQREQVKNREKKNTFKTESIVSAAVVPGTCLTTCVAHSLMCIFVPFASY